MRSCDPPLRKHRHQESGRSEPRTVTMAEPVEMNHEWRQHARCKGMGPELFFADRGEHQTLHTAMEFCNGGVYYTPNGRGGRTREEVPPCPVRTECLEFALSFPKDEDSHGVFGGLVPASRNKIRIARKEAGTYVQVTSIAKDIQSLRGREPRPQ